ncbi:MAG: glycosylhydrolase-like jelly roll fold domain-containing protein, partial [Phycisphaerae bacterium]
VAVRDGVAVLTGSVPAGPVVAALRLAGPAGLGKPILCDCAAGALGIGPWGIVGYPTYSGLADYSIEFDLPDAYRKDRLVLDLGEVGCAAHLAVNGRDLGTQLWAPYTFDITEAIRPGGNAIRITVADTAANGSGKDLPMERLAAGIIGPVRIRCLREVTIKAR